MNAQLNTYAEDNECQSCGDKQEVIYHHYINVRVKDYSRAVDLIIDMESQYEH